jgi:hypothetical protein
VRVAAHQALAVFLDDLLQQLLGPRAPLQRPFTIAWFGASV